MSKDEVIHLAKEGDLTRKSGKIKNLKYIK